MSRTESDRDVESLFTATGDTSLSRRERYWRWLDVFVLAPARIIWSDWRARIGTILMVGYLLMGTVGVMVVPEPVIMQGPQLLGMFEDLSFVLGTDAQGRDLFGLIVHATPPMLKMVAGGAVFSTTVATVVGTLSGYKGGLFDRVTMTFTDVMMTIPGLPLIIVLAAIFSPRNPFLVGILLSVNSWAGLARALRSQVLTLRDEPYVESARVMGLTTPNILRHDIVPQLMPYIGVSFMQSGRRVIFSSVGLYFLGVLPYTGFNWGIILNKAFGAGVLWKPAYIHWLLVPVLTIIGISLSMILLTQGADRLFNPRVRARHASTTPSESPADEDEGSQAATTLRA